MRTLSRTTVSGMTGALALLAPHVTPMPHWLDLSFTFVLAGALAILGKSAAECPLRCPGTDDQGRPRPQRRPWDALSLVPPIALVVLVVLCFTACAVKNPAAGPGNPTAPAYVVSPAITTWSNTVSPLADTVGVVTGTGPLARTATDGALALVALLSAAYARHKSQVTAAMAGAVKQGGSQATQATLDAVDGHPLAPAVRQAIQKAPKKPA